MKTHVSFLILMFINTASIAQKGNNELQISGHYGLPTGNLKDVSRGGIGGGAKFLYGFSHLKQQVTLAAGYTHFPVRKSLSGDYKFFYSTLPVMLGYRFTFGQKTTDGGIYLEGQAGGNYNVIKGSGAQGASAKTSGISFVFASGIGYQINGFDIGAFYQISDLADSDNNITFLGFQIGYSFIL